MSIDTEIFYYLEIHKVKTYNSQETPVIYKEVKFLQSNNN